MLRQRLMQGWLRRELPGWVERGWVTPAHGEAILADVAGRAALGPRTLPVALYLLGVVLLGTGIVTYVAANWDVLPKLAKLSLLLSALWACFGLGLVLDRRGRWPALVGALKLLGVIVFGANVQLIAQVFNIQAHYPNGVLLWALGGLLTAWVLRSQASLVAAVALGLLWSEMEQWGFEDPIHWPFLVFWAACAVPAVRERWRPALHVLALAGVVWVNSTLLGARMRELTDAPAYGFALLLWANAALFAAGRLAGHWPRTEPLSAVARYALLGGLLALLLLASPTLQRTAWYAEWRDPAGPWAWALNGGGLLVTLGLGALWLRAARRAGTLARGAWWRGWAAPGLALGAAMAVVLMANGFLLGETGGKVAVAVNLLLFAGLVWSVYAGYRLGEPFLVNASFVAFALALLARYLETFWTLLSRSLFFMVGGLVLIGGGWWLERTRRRVLEHMAGDEPPDGGAPVAPGREGGP